MRTSLHPAPLGAAALLALLGAAWLLFGWRTVDEPARGVVRYCRFFGRETIVRVDVDRDGRTDGIYRHRWRSPAGAAGSLPWRWTEDRDHDGRWDTWVEDLGVNRDGERELRFRADVDGDGEPDLSFKSLDALSGYEAIQEQRGF